ncbi:MAG: PH domain-containing protein [Propionicimonas sp.]
MSEPTPEPRPGPSFQPPPGWWTPPAQPVPPEATATHVPAAQPPAWPATSQPPYPASEPQAPPLRPRCGRAGAEPGPAEKLTERPHPLTPLVRGWIVLLAIVFGVGRELIPDGSDDGGLPPLELLFAGVGAVAVIAVVAGFLSWRFTRFVVDAEELRIDTGVLVRTSQRIAFERVQAIDVVQPFAARLFQLAELRIDIGGGESAVLRYLSLRRAYELRDYLLARARGHRDAAASSPTELTIDARLSDLSDSDEVLVQVPPATLLLAAVTSHEFFGILLGGVAALLAAIYFDLGWGILGVLIPLGSALVGFIAQRVTGQFNYTLSRRPAGLRISRGLTSLTSQSLPPRRVQAVQISQSLLWRRLGFYRIDLAVVGWGPLSNDEDARGTSTIMLPAGTAEQVAIALGALWPSGDYRLVALTSAPRAARWPHPLSAPFLRWGFDDRFFVSQHGWLVRRWQIVPHTRAQSVALHQGPVSRRLGIADVAVHTAGLQLATRAKGVDAARLREQLAALQAHLHHKPAHDVSDPPPAASDPASPNPY